MNLNKEQQQAVDHFKGVCITTAIPGSGKTMALTSRVVKLIRTHEVSPQNILCLTFTNKAAAEMRERIAKQIGIQSDDIWISTFHAYCVAILRRYGKHVGLTSDFSIYADNDQKELIRKVARMYDYECKANSPELWRMKKAVDNFREDIEDFESALTFLQPIEKEILQEYLKTLDEFNATDFSGILYKTWLLLDKEPRASEVLHKRFQYVLIDEMQDTNTIQYEIVKKVVSPIDTGYLREGNLFVVGDFDQCIYANEKITIANLEGKLSTIPAKEMPVTGRIKSYRNGKIVLQRYKTKCSDATQGVRILLSSGKSISISGKHKLYTTGVKDTNFLVYLMYRPDLGFRVGATNNRLLYGHRTRHENATKLWILESCKDRESALLEEESISLRFGVPTVVFNGAGRGINQDRLDALFLEFGSNGYHVLDYYGLEFDFPLWCAKGYSTHRYSRTQVHLCAHGPKGSQVFYEWTDETQCEIVGKLNVSITRAKPSKNFPKRWRCRKFFCKYADAAEFAKKLSFVTKAGLSERITVATQHLFLTTASAIREGCCLPVISEDTLSLDAVVKIEPISGKFISIDVDDSCVFFNADNVLSHNSIFSWRGAKPENIDRVRKDFNNVSEVILHRNYRSTASILDGAQRLIRNNENATSVKLTAHRGDGNDIAITRHVNPDEESYKITKAIESLQGKGYKYSDFAVLYRTNVLSKPVEMAMRQANIPYRVVGGFSFFDRSEIKSVFAYLSFLSNTSDTISFERAISYPPRKVGDKAIGKLEKLCKKEGISMLEACKKSGDVVGILKEGVANLHKFAEVTEYYQSEMKQGKSLGAVAGGYLMDTGYYKHMKKEGEKDPDTAKRVDNIEALLVDIADYSKRKPNSTLSDYLHIQSLLSDLDKADEDSVTLLTMHTSKGLEFPVVFIVGVEEKIIPHVLSLNEGREDEERRLMYVAMTRAESYLFINYCTSRMKYNWKAKTNTWQPCQPSKFIAEIE